jgi:hypothetical protein
MSHEDNFPRRRKRQFGIGDAVTTTLAVYGAYHLAMWAWESWKTASIIDSDGTCNATKQVNQLQNHRSANRTRKQRHMARCRSETATTLTAFRELLQTKIDEGTETTIYRAQLKEIRKLKSDDTKHQEAILWMKIQVETVTRLMTSVYAYALLFTALTLQVHFVAGKMYRKDNDADGSNETDLGSQRALLLSYDAFWDRGGLDDLLNCVRDSVTVAVKEWNIHDPNFALHMTISTVQQAMSEIRVSVEAGNLLQRFIVLDSDESLSSNDPLFNEMCDILESPMANDAMNESLKCVFYLIHQQFIVPMFASDSTGIPLAHVISQIKTMTSCFFKTDLYLSEMEKLPAVQEASAISFGQ